VGVPTRLISMSPRAMPEVLSVAATVTLCGSIGSASASLSVGGTLSKRSDSVRNVLDAKLPAASVRYSRSCHCPTAGTCMCGTWLRPVPLAPDEIQPVVELAFVDAGQIHQRAPAMGAAGPCAGLVQRTGKSLAVRHVPVAATLSSRGDPGGVLSTRIVDDLALALPAASCTTMPRLRRPSRTTRVSIDSGPGGAVQGAGRV
jgi:hypothetical protein